jgi:hypothetical protein
MTKAQTTATNATAGGDGATTRAQTERALVPDEARRVPPAAAGRRRPNPAYPHGDRAFGLRRLKW